MNSIFQVFAKIQYGGRRWPCWILVNFSNCFNFWTIRSIQYKFGGFFIHRQAIISIFQILLKSNMAARWPFWILVKFSNCCKFWTLWPTHLKFGGIFHSHKGYNFSFANFLKSIMVSVGGHWPLAILVLVKFSFARSNWNFVDVFIPPKAKIFHFFGYFAWRTFRSMI
jgi:hypothetical protein